MLYNVVSTHLFSVAVFPPTYSGFWFIQSAIYQDDYNKLYSTLAVVSKCDTGGCLRIYRHTSYMP